MDNRKRLLITILFLGIFAINLYILDDSLQNSSKQDDTLTLDEIDNDLEDNDRSELTPQDSDSSHTTCYLNETQLGTSQDSDTGITNYPDYSTAPYSVTGSLFNREGINYQTVSFDENNDWIQVSNNAELWYRTSGLVFPGKMNMDYNGRTSVLYLNSILSEYKSVRYSLTNMFGAMKLDFWANYKDKAYIRLVELSGTVLTQMLFSNDGVYIVDTGVLAATCTRNTWHHFVIEYSSLGTIVQMDGNTIYSGYSNSNSQVGIIEISDYKGSYWDDFKIYNMDMPSNYVGSGKWWIKENIAGHRNVAFCDPGNTQTLNVLKPFGEVPYSTSVSYEWWHYSGDGYHWREQVHFAGSSDSLGYLYLSWNGQVGYYDNSQLAYDAICQIPLNTWNHFRISLVGNTWSLWVNSVNKGTFSNSYGYSAEFQVWHWYTSHTPYPGYSSWDGFDSSILSGYYTGRNKADDTKWVNPTGQKEIYIDNTYDSSIQTNIQTNDGIEVALKTFSLSSTSNVNGWHYRYYRTDVSIEFQPLNFNVMAVDKLKILLRYRNTAARCMWNPPYVPGAPRSGWIDPQIIGMQNSFDIGSTDLKFSEPAVNVNYWEQNSAGIATNKLNFFQIDLDTANCLDTDGSVKITLHLTQYVGIEESRILGCSLTEYNPVFYLDFFNVEYGLTDFIDNIMIPLDFTTNEMFDIDDVQLQCSWAYIKFFQYSTTRVLTIKNRLMEVVTQIPLNPLDITKTFTISLKDHFSKIRIEPFDLSTSGEKWAEHCYDNLYLYFTDTPVFNLDITVQKTERFSYEGSIVDYGPQMGSYAFLLLPQNTQPVVGVTTKITNWVPQEMKFETDSTILPDLFNYWSLNHIFITNTSTNLTKNNLPSMGIQCFSTNSDFRLVFNSQSYEMVKRKYLITNFDKAPLTFSCKIVNFPSMVPTSSITQYDSSNFKSDYRIQVKITRDGVAPDRFFDPTNYPRFAYKNAETNGSIWHRSDIILDSSEEILPFEWNLDANAYNLGWQINTAQIDNPYYQMIDYGTLMPFNFVEQLQWVVEFVKDTNKPNINPTASLDGATRTMITYVPYQSQDESVLSVSFLNPDKDKILSHSQKFNTKYTLNERYNHVSYSKLPTELLNYTSMVYMDNGNNFYTPSQSQLINSLGSCVSSKDLIYAFPTIIDYDTNTGKTTQKIEIYFRYNHTDAFIANGIQMRDLSLLNLTLFAKVFYDSNYFNLEQSLSNISIYDFNTKTWSIVEENLLNNVNLINKNGLVQSMITDQGDWQNYFTPTNLNLPISQIVDQNETLIKFDVYVSGIQIGATFLDQLQDNAVIIGSIGKIKAEITGWKTPSVTSINYIGANVPGEVLLLNYVPGTYELTLSATESNQYYLAPSDLSFDWNLLSRPVNIIPDAYPNELIAAQEIPFGITATDGLRGFNAKYCKVQLSSYNQITDTTAILGTLLTDETGTAHIMAKCPAGTFVFQYTVIENNGVGHEPFTNTEFKEAFWQPTAVSSDAQIVEYCDATLLVTLYGVDAQNRAVAGSNVYLVAQLREPDGDLVNCTGIQVILNSELYATVNTFQPLKLDLTNPISYTLDVVFPSNEFYSAQQFETIITAYRSYISITNLNPSEFIVPYTDVIVTALVQNLSNNQAPMIGVPVQFFVENADTHDILWTSAITISNNQGYASITVPWNANYLQAHITVCAQVVADYPTIDTADSSKMLIDYIFNSVNIDLQTNSSNLYVLNQYALNYSISYTNGTIVADQTIQIQIYEYSSGTNNLIETYLASTSESAYTMDYCFKIACKYEIIVSYPGSTTIYTAPKGNSYIFEIQKRPINFLFESDALNYYLENNHSFVYTLVDGLNDSVVSNKLIHVQEIIQNTDEVRIFDLMLGKNDSLIWRPLRIGTFSFMTRFDGDPYYLAVERTDTIVPTYRPLEMNCSLATISQLYANDHLQIRISLSDSLNNSIPKRLLNLELFITCLGEVTTITSTFDSNGISSHFFTIPYNAANTAIKIDFSLFEPATYPIYEGITQNYTIPISLIDTWANFTKIETNNFVGIQNNLTFTFLDNFNNPLISFPLNVYLKYADTNYISQSSLTSTASMNFVFTGTQEGFYDFIVEFLGDSQFKAQNFTKRFYLVKRSIQINDINFTQVHSVNHPLNLKFQISDVFYNAKLAGFQGFLSFYNPSTETWELIDSEVSNENGLFLFDPIFDSWAINMDLQFKMNILGGANYYDGINTFEIHFTKVLVFFVYHATPNKAHYHLDDVVEFEFKMYDLESQSLISGVPFNLTIMTNDQGEFYEITSGTKISLTLDQCGTLNLLFNITNQELYNDTAATYQISIQRYQVSLNLEILPSTSSCIIGEDIIFSLELLNFDNEQGIAGQTISFGYIIGSDYYLIADIFTDSEGKIQNLHWTIPSALYDQEIQFQFEYNENQKYMGDLVISDSLLVIKRNFTIIPSVPISISSKDNTVLPFSIHDSLNGSSLTGISIEMTIQYPNGTIYVIYLTPTNIQGITQYTFEVSPYLTYLDSLQISYSVRDIDRYNDFTSQWIRLNIEKMTANLTMQYNKQDIIPNKAFILTFSLTDQYSNSLDGRTIAICYSHPMESGTFQVIIGDTDIVELTLHYAGLYAFTLSYEGEQRFNPILSNINVNAGKINSTMILSFMNALNVTTSSDFMGTLVNYTLPTNLQNYTLVAFIKSKEFGYPIFGAEIVFVLHFKNGSTVIIGSNITDINGIAYLQWKNDFYDQKMAFQAIIQNSSIMNFAESNPVYLSFRRIKTRVDIFASETYLRKTENLILNLTLSDEFRIKLSNQILNVKIYQIVDQKHNKNHYKHSEHCDHNEHFEIIYDNNYTTGQFVSLLLTFPDDGHYRIVVTFAKTILYAESKDTIMIHVVPRENAAISVIKSGLINYTSTLPVNFTVLLFELEAGNDIFNDTMVVRITKFGKDYSQTTIVLISVINNTFGYVFGSEGIYLIEIYYQGCDDYQGCVYEEIIVVNKKHSFDFSFLFFGCICGTSVFIPKKNIRNKKAIKYVALMMVGLFTVAEYSNLGSLTNNKPPSGIDVDSELANMMSMYVLSGETSTNSNSQQNFMNMIVNSIGFEPKFNSQISIASQSNSPIETETLVNGDSSNDENSIGDPNNGIESNSWDEIYAGDALLGTQNDTNSPIIDFSLEENSTINFQMYMKIFVSDDSNFVQNANYWIMNESNNVILEEGDLIFEAAINCYFYDFRNFVSTTTNLTFMVNASDYSNNIASNSIRLKFINQTEFDEIYQENMDSAESLLDDLIASKKDYINVSFTSVLTGYYSINVRNRYSGKIILSTINTPIVEGQQIQNMIYIHPLQFDLGFYEIAIVFSALNSLGYWDSFEYTQNLIVQKETPMLDIIFEERILQNQFTSITANMTEFGFDEEYQQIKVGLAGKTVNFYIWNGFEYQFIANQITDFNGIATIIYNCSFPKGNYLFKGEFAGDPIYQNSSVESMLTCNGYEIGIEVTNNPSSIYGDILEVDTKISYWTSPSIAGTYISYNLTNVENEFLQYQMGSIAVDENGIAQFACLANVPIGDYYLDVFIANDKQYADTIYRYGMGSIVEITKESTELTIIKPIELSGLPIPISNYEIEQLSARLTGLNTRPISNEMIEFYIKIDQDLIFLGKEMTAADGIATISINTSYLPNTYEILAQYAGNDYQLDTYDYDLITISKSDVVFECKPIDITFGDAFQLEGRIYEQSTNRPLQYENLEFVLLENGSPISIPYSCTSDETGLFFYQISQTHFLASGTYSIQINLLSSDNFNFKSQIFENYLTVESQATSLLAIAPTNISCLEFLVLKAYLTDASGDPIELQSLQIHLYQAGSTVDITEGLLMTTDSTGLAKNQFGYLVPGIYQITLVYDPLSDTIENNDGYAPCSTTIFIESTPVQANLFVKEFNGISFFRDDTIDIRFATIDKKAAQYIIPVDLFIVNMEEPTTEHYLSHTFLYPIRSDGISTTQFSYKIPLTSFYQAGIWKIICRVDSVNSLFEGETTFTFDLMERTHISCSIAYTERTNNQHYVNQPETLTYTILDQDNTPLRDVILDWTTDHYLVLDHVNLQTSLYIPTTGHGDIEFIPFRIGQMKREASYVGSRFYGESSYDISFDVLRRPIELYFDSFADTDPKFVNPLITHRTKSINIQAHVIDYLNQIPISSHKIEISVNGRNTRQTIYSDIQGLYNGIKTNSQLDLKEAGFYQLSVFAPQTEIFDSKAAFSTNELMVYENVTLDLISDGSGCITTQGFKLKSQYRFIDEDSSVISVMHLNIISDENSELVDAFETIRCPEQNIFIPSRFGTTIAPSSYSVKIFASELYPWLYSQYRYINSIREYLPFIIDNDMDSNVERTINVVGDISQNIKMPTFEFHSVLEDINFAILLLSAPWYILFYGMFYRSIQMNMNFWVQIMLLVIVTLIGGIFDQSIGLIHLLGGLVLLGLRKIIGSLDIYFRNNAERYIFSIKTIWKIYNEFGNIFPPNVEDIPIDQEIPQVVLKDGVKFKSEEKMKDKPSNWANIKNGLSNLFGFKDKGAQIFGELFFVFISTIILAASNPDKFGYIYNPFRPGDIFYVNMEAYPDMTLTGYDIVDVIAFSLYFGYAKVAKGILSAFSEVGDISAGVYVSAFFAALIGRIIAFYISIWLYRWKRDLVIKGSNGEYHKSDQWCEYKSRIQEKYQTYISGKNKWYKEIINGLWQIAESLPGPLITGVIMAVMVPHLICAEGVGYAIRKSIFSMISYFASMVVVKLIASWTVQSLCYFLGNYLSSFANFKSDPILRAIAQ